VDFEANGLSKQINAVQKEIAAKKKVVLDAYIPNLLEFMISYRPSNQQMT
jgi:hypothetical protein